MEDLIGLINQLRPFRFLVIMGITVFAFSAAVFFVERVLRHRRRPEHELIADAARREGIGEYDLFLRAAEKWGVSEETVSKDFKIYLARTEVPFYVRALVRPEDDDQDPTPRG